MELDVPFNIASYAPFTHMLAHVCNLVLETLTHMMGDAHVYLDHAEALKTQLDREPRDFPMLQIKREKGGSINGCRLENFEVNDYNPRKRIVMKICMTH